MITNLHRNIMGTTSFDGKFQGMRKAQDFIVYPLAAGETTICIQSDTRYGRLDLTTGNLEMSKSHANGAGSMAFALDTRVKETVSSEELTSLRDFIRSTGSKELVGSSMVLSNNEGALTV